jgi:hypothetical protein
MIFQTFYEFTEKEKPVSYINYYDIKGNIWDYRNRKWYSNGCVVDVDTDGKTLLCGIVGMQVPDHVQLYEWIN